MIGRIAISSVRHKDRDSSEIGRRNTTPLLDDDLYQCGRSGCPFAWPTGTNIANERRNSRRFPITLRGEVRAPKSCLKGRTVNLSSGGLLMYCAGSINVGVHVTVRLLGWPVTRNDLDVALVVEGVVVRSSAGYIAVRRERYEFIRTPATF
jgi:PilZ domain